MPFFEPWPEPESEVDVPEPEVDLPWMPPRHVVGVVVPLRAELHRGADVVIRVTHAVAFRRGVELHVGAWLRPGTVRPLSSAARVFEEQEPRVGLRLADGTRLGHRAVPGGGFPGEDEEAPFSFLQNSGSGGALHSCRSWWLAPLPDGDHLEVVAQWEHQGVPECSARIDLAMLRDAAEGEDVLWEPPPPPGEGGFGWFAYAPFSGETYRGQTFDS